MDIYIRLNQMKKMHFRDIICIYQKLSFYIRYMWGDIVYYLHIIGLIRQYFGDIRIHQRYYCRKNWLYIHINIYRQIKQNIKHICIRFHRLIIYYLGDIEYIRQNLKHILYMQGDIQVVVSIRKGYIVILLNTCHISIHYFSFSHLLRGTYMCFRNHSIFQSYEFPNMCSAWRFLMIVLR